MLSFAVGIIAILLLAEAMLLVYLGSQKRSLRAFVGALLALIAFVLAVVPDSTFFIWMVGIFKGAAGYVASVLFVRSKVGVVSYSVLIVLIGLLGRVWDVAPAWGKKKAARGKRWE